MPNPPSLREFLGDLPEKLKRYDLDWVSHWSKSGNYMFWIVLIYAFIVENHHNMLWILHQRKLTLVCVWSINLCISMVEHSAVPGWYAVLFHQEIRHSRPVTAAVLQFTAIWFLSAVNSNVYRRLEAHRWELRRLLSHRRGASGVVQAESSATLTSSHILTQTKLQVFSSWWPPAISRLYLGQKSVAFLTDSYTLHFQVQAVRDPAIGKATFPPASRRWWPVCGLRDIPIDWLWRARGACLRVVK